MSDVPKRWQRNAIPSRDPQDIAPNPLRSSLLTTGSSASVPLPYDPTSANRYPTTLVPPVPPRPGRPDGYPSSGYMGGQQGYGYGMGLGYSPYMQHYSGGYGGALGGYGGSLGGYGGYGGGLGGYEGSESSFVRDAQESTHSAFSAIETIVRAVGSVALLLESTYMALNTSFRAILGLADHFSRLKTSLFGAISGLSFLSKLQSWLHRLLVLLRVRSPLRDAEFNSVWHSAALAGDITSVEQLTPEQKFSLWPFLSFFTIILALPYLLWRVTKSFAAGAGREEEDDLLWCEGKEEHVLLKANHTFSTQSPRELSFNEGDILIAAPKHKQPHVRGWLLASADQKVGLIPANYMSIVGVRKPELPLEPN